MHSDLQRKLLAGDPIDQSLEHRMQAWWFESDERIDEAGKPLVAFCQTAERI